MSFDPGLNIGEVLSNEELYKKFQCRNSGGMRRSKTTNTLVLVADYTKGLYHDKWIGGVLHYTGMGKNGDQDISYDQNATLAGSGHNGVDVHLFEVIDEREYIYCGRIELVDKPYTDIQPGEDGKPRKVWMFPIRPVPDNDVEKPPFFVFKDMAEYKEKGKYAEARYRKFLAEKKKSGSKTTYVLPVIPKPQPKPQPKPKLVIPADIVGKKVSHKSFGTGVITGIDVDAGAVVVNFDKVGEKEMGYEVCMKNKLLQFA